MPRPILEESRIHPAIRDKVATHRIDIVREVEAAIAANPIVVVGLIASGEMGKLLSPGK